MCCISYSSNQRFRFVATTLILKRCRRTGCPPQKLSAGHVVLGPYVPLGQLVLGSGVPLRINCPPTLYHEAEIILHCAIICSCFTQRGTSVLLGACSRGGHAVLEPTVRPSPGKLVLGPRRRCPQNSTYGKLIMGRASLKDKCM